MMHNISLQIFLPENLKENLSEILKETPPKIARFNKDYFFYFLHLITEIPVYNKRNGQTNNGYTTLNAKLLQACTHNYKSYIDYLLQQGIIECDGQYILGKKAKGYRIAGKYKTIVKPITIQNPLLSKKIKKLNRSAANQSTKYKYLQKWFYGLEIDYSSALEFIRAQYEQRIVHPETRTWDKNRNRYKNPINQYNFSIVNISNLLNKQFYFKVDSKVGRLHTNLSNMQSDLRNFITWDGQNLVSIDISNSQPYISSKLFSPDFYNHIQKCKKGTDCKNNFTIQEMTSRNLHNRLKDKTRKLKNGHFSKPQHQPTIPTNQQHNQPTTPLMLEKIAQESMNQDNTKLYIDLVENGELYEYFAKLLDKSIGLKIHNKKDAKLIFFQTMFTSNRFIGQKEAENKRVFKKYFPSVYKLFAAYKKGNPAALPCLLQQIEATLILDIICKRISKEKPNIPIFTIHDSISTTTSHLDYVKRIMIEELTREIGISPNLKIEFWGVSNLNNKYPTLYPLHRLKLA